jgi:hypothetical protein
LAVNLAGLSAGSAQAAHAERSTLFGVVDAIVAGGPIDRRALEGLIKAPLHPVTGASDPPQQIRYQAKDVRLTLVSFVQADAGPSVYLRFRGPCISRSRFVNRFGFRSAHPNRMDRGDTAAWVVADPKAGRLEAEFPYAMHDCADVISIEAASP